ncbi:hypothetical protein F5148DRAFT_1330590 [Russula earlei]|uniref:Uncharacterized protein n=1 Tax=Russula earlei TaxID=71964 RepID=A0ACC0TYJ5_9AGAM|nr:hypothetical protein F5148DRAFT_1330590 [Russula earlei]
MVISTLTCPTHATGKPTQTIAYVIQDPISQSQLIFSLAPDEDLHPLVEYYWRLGFSDQSVVAHVLDHFDKSQYGFSFETIAPFVQEIRERFPTMGARQMVTTLRQDYSLKVPEATIARFLKGTEPEAVELRKARRFRRKRFWSAGIMDILTIDQHDKWKRFGLWLHIGLDPFPGRIAWLKIWWCNRNPRLINSYYIEAGRKIGGIPLITQSDRGTENNVVANCHTVTRHWLDPSLVGTLQHRWCVEKTNIKPEIAWSQLRRQFTPGFESHLDFGYNNGLYNPDDPLEKLVFRWLAIPWLQAELDAWTWRFNSSPPRADKHKLLPQGIPNIIHAKPHLYGSQDFKVVVSSDIFDKMEQEWVQPHSPVFQLVLPTFAKQITTLYQTMGEPAVSCLTFWKIYQDLLALFRALPDDPQLAGALHLADEGANEEVQLLAGLRELRHGDNVVGEHGKSSIT